MGVYVTVNLCKPRLSTYTEFVSQCQHTLVHSVYDIVWIISGRLTKMVLGDKLSNQ